MNDSPRARGNLSSIVTLLLILVVIGLSWRQCWYATPLSDAEMSRRLGAEASESDIHKALSQFKERLDRKEDVERWYGAVAGLAEHPTPQIRSTAAWAMGGAPLHEGFGPPLRKLLADPEIEVRYNAAVSLGARGDPTARATLRLMLDEHVVVAASAGKVEQPRGQGETTRFGQILARIQPRQGAAIDVVAPLSGRLVKAEARHGLEVEAGAELFRIAPGGGQIENALLALGRIGDPEDIPAMQFIAEGRFNVSEPTRRLAAQLIATLKTH